MITDRKKEDTKYKFKYQVDIGEEKPKWFYDKYLNDPNDEYNSYF